MNIIQSIKKEELQSIVNESNSISSILRKLGVSTSCGYYRKHLKKRMESLDLTSFLRNKKINNPLSTSLIKYEDKNLFIENCPADIKTVKARFEKHYPQENCSCCLIKNTWNGKSLNLHLDHINGINNDNRLNNLRWLCPNCHSQTETYTGRNKK
ncbi:hypothetical protein N9955_00110 [bacterium]|nr:hypothetical protein [bacterium]